MKEHKKSKENLIGKIIYGFLLFMPLLAIAVTCAYVIFNKNAYQSYYGETINQVEYKEVNQLELDKEYKWESNNYTNIFNVNNSFIKTDGIDNISSNDTNLVNSLNNYKNQIIYIYFINNGTSNSGISFRDSSNTQLVPVGIHNKEISFTFTAIEYNNIGSDILSCIYSIEYNNYSYLNNAFYYAIDEVEQSPLFNWANNTATYNVLEGTCQTLGITTTFIPMLLAYWLMTSLMYLLYDIALIMVHMAHKKIHEFEGSI